MKFEGRFPWEMVEALKAWRPPAVAGSAFCGFAPSRSSPSGTAARPSACLTPALRPGGLRCALPLAAFPTGNADQVDDAGRCPEPSARRVARMLGG